MTLAQFRTILSKRIPTAEEFVAFVNGQNWKIVRLDDGKPAIRGSQGHPVAKGLAKLLGREPYRTNVLNLVFPPEPPPLPPDTRPMREFAWHDGHRYTQTPDDPRYATEEFAPVGAWWWRWKGESEWQPIQGKGGELCSLLPEG